MVAVRVARIERSEMRDQRSRMSLRAIRATNRLRQGETMTAAAGSAAVRQKGPRVWLDMDQKELDDAYDQAVYAPNRDQLSRRRASNSDLVRVRLGAPQRVAYGPTRNEMLDIFPTKAPN